MQEKDTVTDEYFEDPKRFADLVNGFVFDGEQILKSDDIRVLERWFKKAISVQSLEEFVDYLQKDSGMAKVG